jgi:hypothetical protein
LTRKCQPPRPQRSLTICYVTLLITVVTEHFTVQASDRRLTYPDGTMAEEIANKATLVCYFASFAYTGLARCSVAETTDELLLRCMAKEDTQFPQLIDVLARSASQAIRNLPLPRLTSEQRQRVRRTSFVGCGFLGLRHPELVGRRAVADELHPFIAVVSNAQDLRETWRPSADQEFKAYLTYLPEQTTFFMHVAGQRLFDDERRVLERNIRRCLCHVEHPEPVARILARAIRHVSSRNERVGPNVMCTFVRREDVTRKRKDTFLTAGPVPLVPELQHEAEYFVRMRDDKPSLWIFSPANPADPVHYGPNFACNGFEMKGIKMGRSKENA